MNIFGEVLLFITAFLWSWGAETSKQIKKYEGYHSSAFSFLGGYHRFNRWVMGMTGDDLKIVSLISQGFLAALFFLPVVAIGGAWYYWGYLVFGGLAFVTFRELRAKKKQS